MLPLCADQFDSDSTVAIRPTLSMMAVLAVAAVAALQCPGAENEKHSREIENSIGIKLIPIPVGEFMMGSPKDEKGHRDQEQRHRVRITKPFYMGVYEVTQGQYQRLMNKNPSSFSVGGEFKDKVAGMDTSQFPVEHVTWDEAVAFCKQLTEKEGKLYRLPTEAEWEYACRAGTNTPFEFGSQLNGSEANCDGGKPFGTETKGPYLERPVVVGRYPANGFGLYDMHGNVWEWCADWSESDYYEKSPPSDPTGPKTGLRRAVRGGGWYARPVDCRSASRGSERPQQARSYNGFRVVCEYSP